MSQLGNPSELKSGISVQRDMTFCCSEPNTEPNSFFIFYQQLKTHHDLTKITLGPIVRRMKGCRTECTVVSQKEKRMQNIKICLCFPHLASGKSKPNICPGSRHQKKRTSRFPQFSARPQRSFPAKYGFHCLWRQKYPREGGQGGYASRQPNTPPMQKFASAWALQ